MSWCNEPSDALNSSAQDPTLHVNYAKGMVLGVDDLTQEFTYLAGRDQWTVRELIGYGTTSGLAIEVEDSEDGPRMRVATGAAAVPGGKLVCVPSEQCGVINKWLAKPENAKKIETLIQSGSGTISLYLTLCYADCQTMPVPIPGEPCRAEDELMAPSRVADDYKLELRIEAPSQVEEDALRDFVVWLKQVPIVTTSPPPPADEKIWIAGLRAAAKPWLDAMHMEPPLSSPPSIGTLGDYLFDSPPTSLTIARENMCEFLRVAFRFWVTELRPFWMARRCGAPPNAGDDCVLLARLQIPVVWIGGSPTGAWQVNGSASDILVDESKRPYLAHARLLQEWMLCGYASEGFNTPVALPLDLAPTDAPSFARLETTAAVHIAVANVKNGQTLDTTHHAVLCDRSVKKLNLPKCAASNRGRVYIIKNLASTSVDVNAAEDNVIDGKPILKIAKSKAKTLLSDGVKHWHVIATMG